MEPSEARIKTVKSGQLEGILTQKSANWIDVRADDGYVNRYMPYWKGESPSRGGGFDPRMLEVISNLVVGNRVYLSWHWDGHLRINQVDIIVPPEESGTFEGYLLEVGDKWIDVQNFNEGKPWRFYLPWIGGYPQGGGGYDREMLKFFHDHNPKIPVYFDWRFDLRPRITRIVKYEEAKFVPFFVGKEEEYIRRMTGGGTKKGAGSNRQSVRAGSNRQSVRAGSNRQSVRAGSNRQSVRAGSNRQSVRAGSNRQSVRAGSNRQSVRAGSSGQSVRAGSNRQSVRGRLQRAIRSRICPYLSKLGSDFEKLFILCDCET